jgi:para-nitrobenzyl esterase
MDTAQTPTAPIAQVYRGIRYATAARWQRPSLYTIPSGQSVSADTMGNACAQGARPLAAHLSEDCFFLNVWAPRTATASNRYPVMVFIHGGAFVIGKGSAPIYNGAYLAQMDTVVVVTLNYRLGSLGFLSNSAASIPANLGLLDQQTAMQWVRRNVSAFGGDPGRVTIFGESAGAMSVGLHLFDMPSSDSLFNAAIMESNPMGVVYRDSSTAQSDGRSFATTLCKLYRGDLCLIPGSAQSWFASNYATVPVDTVLFAQAIFDSATTRVALGGLPQALPWAPAVDSSLVFGQPMGGFAPGMRKKPYVFGMNQDEGLLFASLAASKVDTTTYRLLVYDVFKASGATVMGQVNGGYPYKAPGHASIAGMSQPASALDMLINDMAFDCGNLASANQNAASDTVFGYLFARDTVPFKMWPAGPCSLATSVCHGYEIPYVFNTLAQADTVNGGTGKPDIIDWGLAAAMSAAWGSFAKTHRFPTALGWTQYSAANGTLFRWAGLSNGTVSTLPTTANCKALWYGIYPLSRYSPGAGSTASSARADSGAGQPAR